MRTAVSKLTLRQPKDLREALRMLDEERPLRPMAGCTDLYVDLNFGTLKQQRFVNLWGLKELRYIRPEGERLRIGALTTYTDLIRSPEVRRRAPILAAASREIGGVQIQNRGTLGGNIANASPAGDTLPVLAVLEADVILVSRSDERRVSFNSFYTGYRKSVARDDELVAAVELPPATGSQWFRKVGTRAAQAISKVVMAGLRDQRPRVALGSVAPTVVRLPRTEDCLTNGAELREAQEIMRTEIQPIDDLRSTAAYRLQVSVNLLRRFWEDTAGGNG